MYCFILGVIFGACVRPWQIPSADACDTSPDGRMFFFYNRTACLCADGRSAYCVGHDGGFCALRDLGDRSGMYQVECG